MPQSPEDQLKERLNLKYSAASKLVQQAKSELGIAGDASSDEQQEEVLQAATANFNGLSEPEQQEMIMTAEKGDAVPEWKQKAERAARASEARWDAEAQEQQPEEADKSADPTTTSSSQAPTPTDAQGLADSELPANVVKQTVTTKVGDQPPTVETKTQDKPDPTMPNEDNTTKTTCYCVIL